MNDDLIENDDIEVIIDGEPDDSVKINPDGSSEIRLPTGDVLIQLNPQAESAENEDPKDFYKNLCDAIGDARLGTIAEELIEQISADDTSRAEMLQIRARGIGLMGFKLEPPKSGVGDTASSQDGMSVVTNPLLADGCLRAWANAQAELLPADGPCKVEDWDLQELQEDMQLADDFERDMNFYLTEIATEYVPDTQHMLLWGTIFGGSGIKKIYQNPRLNRPCSESVDVKDFIVSDTTKDLKTCQRITHQITMRPSELKRLQMKGYYRDFDLPPANMPETNAVDQRIADQQGTMASNQATRPEDQPYTLWETQCELNLPEFAPGEFAKRQIPLPFLVTIEKDTRVILSIRRDWKPEDEDCTRKQMYVKYPYIPGPGFYGTGLLNVLGNSSAAMTAAWRLSLDAGMYANFMGGLISDIGNRQKSSVLRPAPGEFVPIQTNGQDIREIIMALPYKDVTPGLMALIDKITTQAKAVGGAIEIPVKEGVKDIPVGTMLAYVEQAAQVMLAAHKGMHTAQSEELTLIADLFRENPESFWRANKRWKNSWNEQRLFQALDKLTLTPRSDPNVPSHVHRLLKGVALIQLKSDPDFKPYLSIPGILDRVMGVLREDPKGIRINPAPQPAQPNPDMLNAAAKLKDSDTKAKKANIDAFKAQTDAQNRQAELQAEEGIETTRLAQSMITHAHDADKANHGRVMDVQKHALDVAKHSHDASMDVLDRLQPQEPSSNG